MPARVLSLGSVLIDVTIEVTDLPLRGGDVLASASQTHIGGGFNVAAAVARQGVTSVYASVHGAGPYGSMARAAFAEEDIEVALPARTDIDTGICVALVEPDGERTMITATGTEAVLRPGDLDAVEVRDTDLVSVSGYDLAYPGAAEELARWVLALPPAVLVAVDPGPLVMDIPSRLLGPILERATLLTLNQREARMLAGSAAAGPALLADLTRSLSPGSPRYLVVREGATGCIALAQDDPGPVQFIAPVVTVLDTTGAGDTHTGVLLAELASGRPFLRAAERASLAATWSVQYRGSATAPRTDQLDEFEQEHRRRTGAQLLAPLARRAVTGP